MAISRRQFNATMMAAMGSMLTRRALGQAAPASGAAQAGASVTDALPPFPTVPGPVAAGPLTQLQRKRLHALDDLHLDATGGDPQGNLDKITDAMVQLFQQVRDGAAQGGEIYFPDGTYCLPGSIRLLPDIALVGESAQGSIIKNIVVEGRPHSMNSELIMAGHDQPAEGVHTKQINFRPFAAVAQKGDREIRVRPEDYTAVAVGDEIKLLSATNSQDVKNKTIRRPDAMVKVHVTAKKTSGAERILEIDRPLPWTFAPEGDSVWGSNRGMPVWFLVKEWYYDVPTYWMKPGNHGYETLAALGPDWVKGWSGRRNLFQNLTLWTPSGYIMMRGMPCDSVFDHCIMKAEKSFYGNSMQYTQINDCVASFSDQICELSYNCLYCTFSNLLAEHDTAGNDVRTDALGTICVHERSEGIIFDGLTVRAATRPNGPRSNILRIAGDHNAVRNAVFDLPDVSTFFRLCATNVSGSRPAQHLTFRNLTVNMPGRTLNNFATIILGAGDIAFQGVRINAGTVKSFANLNDAKCHDITFTDVVSPGPVEVGANVQGVKVERCDFAGGITGPYASAVQVTAGTPNPARWG